MRERVPGLTRIRNTNTSGTNRGTRGEVSNRAGRERGIRNTNTSGTTGTTRTNRGTRGEVSKRAERERGISKVNPDYTLVRSNMQLKHTSNQVKSIS